DTERCRREYLVRDAEQWPKDVDAAVRIDDADVQEVAPAGDDESAREQDRRIPRRTPERRHETAEKILQHETTDARTGVEGGQDEDRLEHDREVVPEREQALPERGREDARHPDRERWRAPGTRE